MFVRVAQTGSNSEYLTNAALLMKMRLDSDKQRATAAPALDVLSPLRPPGASLDEVCSFMRRCCEATCDHASPCVLQAAPRGAAEGREQVCRVDIVYWRQQCDDRNWRCRCHGPGRQYCRYAVRCSLVLSA